MGLIERYNTISAVGGTRAEPACGRFSERSRATLEAWGETAAKLGNAAFNQAIGPATNGGEEPGEGYSRRLTMF